MPECQKCGQHFSNKIKIDGISHVLQHRRYCLECSPFGLHNTRKIHLDGLMCKCEVCDKEYIYVRNKGGTRRLCGSCSANRHKINVKKRCIEYKGGKCEMCGYNRCVSALGFHHIDPATKKFNISGSHTRKWQVMMTELDKCIMVCANCHAEIESGCA